MKKKFTSEELIARKKISDHRKRFAKLCKLQNYIVRHFGYDGLVIDCMIELKNGKTIFHPINIQEAIALEGMHHHVAAELTLESVLPRVPSLYDYFQAQKKTPTAKPIP